MTLARVRVGEVLRLERRPVTPDPTQEHVSIGIRSFGKGIFHYEPTLGSQLPKLRFFKLVPDCLVVSNIKAWEGAVAVAGPNDAGCIASNRFLTYEPVEDRIDVGWARWFFLSEWGNELLQRASPGSADRNRTLAIQRFEALEIPLPPIDDQRSVAVRLDRVESAATELRYRTDRVSTLVDALSVSIASRTDLDEATKLAAGWQREKLGAVMQQAGEAVSVDPTAEYPNVGIFSFGRGVFKKPPINGGTTSATTVNRITAGQFVYSRLFAFEGAYGYVASEYDGHYVSNEFPVFDPDPDRLSARWLATVMRSPDRWAELGGRSKGLGVRRQRVPVEAVLEYEMWLPPMTEQQSMVAAIDRLEEVSSCRQQTTARVGALLPAATNEAFAGLSQG